MVKNDTPEDEDIAEDIDESVKMDGVEVFGSPTPISNGVSDAISKPSKPEPGRYLIKWTGALVNTRLTLTPLESRAWNTIHSMEVLKKSTSR